MKNFLESTYLSFQFDRKTMGFTFFIPVIMFIIALLILLFIPRESTEIYDNIIVIQGVFIPFSCWCLMYRLSEMYEDGAQETLIPYYAKRFILDFFRYFIVNLFGVFLLSAVFVVKYGSHYLSIINGIHFLLLLLVYMLFGTALIVLIKNMEIALTIILIYTVLEVVTLGEFMPWPHIFLFNPPVWDPISSTKFTILSVTIIVLAIITFVFIKKADKKPQ